MTLGVMFWVLMLIALVFGGWMSWPNPRGLGMSFMVWTLLLLVGWRMFGPPIHAG